MDGEPTQNLSQNRHKDRVACRRELSHFEFPSEVREIILRRHDNTCAQCQCQDKKLQIHHRYITVDDANTYAIPESLTRHSLNGLPLCESCHLKANHEQKANSSDHMVAANIQMLLLQTKFHASNTEQIPPEDVRVALNIATQLVMKIRLEAYPKPKRHR